jgi:hypothetical protein
LNREVCSPKLPSQWFANGPYVDLEGYQFGLGESFHPNALGHELIATAFKNQALNPVEGKLGRIEEGDLLRYSLGEVLTPRLSTVVIYRGSDIITTLVSPSGERFSRITGQPNVTADNGATWDNLEISDPEQGTWTVELYGAEIDEGGEPFQFQWYLEPFPNVAPVAAGTLALSGATVTVDTRASYDADGSIVETGIDFGDGVVKFGTTATHTYVNTETVQITMWVKDDDGAYDFANVGTVVDVSGSSVPGTAPDFEAPAAGSVIRPTPGSTGSGPPGVASANPEPTPLPAHENDLEGPVPSSMADSPHEADPAKADRLTEGGSTTSLWWAVTVALLAAGAISVARLLSTHRRGS